MADYLDLALKYLGVKKDECLVLRESEDEVIVVVDKGIAGCPKYVIPRSKLVEVDVPLPFTEEPIPEPEPEPEEPESEDDYDELDLETDDIGYRVLQQMAKEQGIPANQSRDDLVIALGLEEE